MLIAVTLGLVSCGQSSEKAENSEPIKVGVLFSQTGTMRNSELPVLRSVLMAIDQINQEGGLLGRPLKPVIADGGSDPALFASGAEALLDDGVAVIFGCWTSSSRKAVIPVLETRDGLLFYPLQYEGVETSPQVVYAGASPNQQIIPAVSWAMEHLGTRVFLVGSDYVFPRVAHAIIRDQVEALGGEVVGEAYLPLGSDQVSEVIQVIKATQPTFILNTINGDSNQAFFRGLRAAGITPATIPVISFSLGESELSALSIPQAEGDYAAWTYFQTIDSAANRRFIRDYQTLHGADQVVSDPMEAAYSAVLLWAQAVRASGSTVPVSVRTELPRQSVEGPGGWVYLDARSGHFFKTPRIGKIKADGQFEIIWESDVPVRPVPYPLFRTAGEWDDFTQNLYRTWGNQWTAPQP